MEYVLTVNGQRRTVESRAGTPLLWVLREALGLTGTKYGCGIGTCGACTIHYGGRPLRSCLLPVERAVGGAITTIEGLSTDGSHPVQRAWVEADAPQCGYCHSGQIMTAVALLEETPRPDEAAIDRAMATVLCRCGTYPRIRDAIRRAAGLPGDE